MPPRSKRLLTTICLFVLCGLLCSPSEGFKVLIFEKTIQPPHINSEAATVSLRKAGTSKGWVVNNTANDAVFNNKATLLAYDVIVFSYTAGDILTEAQQTNFQSWFASGNKGWVGIHSAAATEYDWTWYGSLVGAYIQQPFAATSKTGVLRVADRVHPSTSHLSNRWTLPDAMFNFMNSSESIRQRNHVLFDVDEHSFVGGSMGFDHPLAWCKIYEGGRSFYSSLGNAPNAWTDPNLVAHIVGAISWAGGLSPGDCGASLDTSYEKETIWSFGPGEEPMHLAVLPSNGFILFATRQGFLRVFNPVTYQITVAAQLLVDTSFEDGLLGILVDSQFSETGFIFIYWSPAGQARGTECNMLSRFAIINSTIVDMNSRLDLLKVPVQRDQCCHSGGSMNWDNEGNLLLTVGDNTNPFTSGGYAPIDEQRDRAYWDAQRTSANTNDLRGKVLRISVSRSTTIDANHPSYTVPAGNLFPPSSPPSSTRPEIYAMGLRNPFRSAVDPLTGVVYIGDVGPDGDENPSRGPRGYDQLLVIPKNSPKNFGWPYCRANLKPYIDYNFATQQSGAAFNCMSLINNSPNNNGLINNLPPSSPATIWYPYGESTEFPELNSEKDYGRAAMVMHVFRPLDYHNNSSASYRMPDYFQGGTVLFADWSRDVFKEVKFDESLNIVKINSLWSSFTWQHPIDAIVSPTDGSLFILEFGTDYIGTGASLTRMKYVGIQQTPSCTIGTNTTTGSIPLAVKFSSAKSKDPNGYALSFKWDFEGDGVVDSTSRGPTYTYKTYGGFVVRLTVTNSKGFSSTCSTTINAGNNAPIIKLRRPTIGSVVKYGVPTTYKVFVSDKEDGNTGSHSIACSSVIVTPGLGHNDHVHDNIPQKGCTGSFIPGREDTVGEFYTVLRAQYTDRGFQAAPSLTTTMSVRFQPNIYEAENYDAMSGVATDTTQDISGNEHVGWIDDGDWTMYKNWNLQGIDSVTLRVASGQTPNGVLRIRINSLTGRIIATARIPLTGGWQNWIDVTVPVADTNQWFEIDLGQVQQISTLVMSCGPAQYPRGYEVYASSNPEDNSNRYGFPIEYIVTGNGTSNVLTIVFPAKTQARFVKIVQTGQNSQTWSIQELNMYDQNTQVLTRQLWTFRASKTAIGSSVSNVADGNATSLWSLGESQRNGNVALYFTYTSILAGERGLFNFNYFTFNGLGAQG